MLGTKRLTDQELDALIARLGGVDFGRWRESDVVRAMEFLGWELHRGKAGEEGLGALRAETGYSTGSAFADMVPASANINTDAEYYAIEMMILKSAERGKAGEEHRMIVFRQILRQILSVLGEPDVRGGDGGPWVRWRDPVATLELHLRRFYGGVSLRILATEAMEALEARNIVHGDTSGWRAYSRDEAELPTEPVVKEIAEFADRLTGCINDMVGDVPIMDTAATLILRTNDWSGRFVQVVVDGSIRVEASDAVRDPYRGQMGRLANMGFRPPGGPMPTWSRTFTEVGRADAAAAAHMLVDALQIFGIDDLFDIQYDGFTADGERLYLPVLGIAGRSSF